MKFVSKLLERNKMTDEVSEFVFSKDSDFFYEPGQFATFLVTHSSGKKLRRSYSITNLPEENFLKFCIKKYENGKLTPVLFDMKIGDELKIIGPAGQFVCLNPKTDLVFVSNGTGIAPFISIIQNILYSGSEKEITLIAGFKHDKDVLYKELFDEWIRSYPHFTYEYCISRDENTVFTKGRVQVALGKILNFEPEKPDIKIDTGFENENNSESKYFLCGGEEMISDSVKLLKEKDVSDENILIESYSN